MKDIAKRADVSVVTVSRALKNHPGLPKKTCQRIQKIATKMGYRPNPMLSVLMASLRRSRMGKGKRAGRRDNPGVDRNGPVIAFLFSNPNPEQFDDPGMPLGAMFAGARARGAELGYKVERFRLDEPGMSETRMRQLLRARSIPGIIMAPLVDPIPEVDFDWSGFACSTIGYSYTASVLHRVANDQFLTMQLAVEKLVARGYRRIGLVMHRLSDERTNHRWSGGFLSLPLLRGKEAARRVPVFYWEGETPAEGPAGLGDWMKRHEPDAVITVHPYVPEWIEQRGWRVPEDVGLVDLDLQGRGRTQRAQTGREVSGVNRRHDLLGAMALDLVAEQLHLNEQGVPNRPKTVMLGGDWEEGATLRALWKAGSGVEGSG